MGNNEQINIKPIPPTSFAGLDKETSKVINQQAHIGRLTRINFDVNQELAEVIKDYSYYRGMTQREVLIHVLEQYFQKNPPPKRPKEVIERSAKRIDKRRGLKSNGTETHAKG